MQTDTSSYGHVCAAVTALKAFIGSTLDSMVLHPQPCVAEGQESPPAVAGAVTSGVKAAAEGVAAAAAGVLTFAFFAGVAEEAAALLAAPLACTCATAAAA